MPEGRINKMADLQETKFLHLVWQICIISVHTPKCNYLYLCVEQHQHYVLLAWRTSPYFMFLDQIYPIIFAYVDTSLWLDALEMFCCMIQQRLRYLLLFVVYLTTLSQYLRLYSVDFYSSLIRLPSSSEAGETRVRNMAAEFCRGVPIVLVGFFNMP
jgi:hypothetical protein